MHILQANKNSLLIANTYFRLKVNVFDAIIKYLIETGGNREDTPVFDGGGSQSLKSCGAGDGGEKCCIITADGPPGPAAVPILGLTAPSSSTSLRYRACR